MMRATTSSTASGRALVALVALLAGACGGGDDSTTAPTPSTSTGASSPTADPVVGERVQTARGNFVAVYGYQQPAPVSDGPAATAGAEFATIDAEVCLGPADDVTPVSPSDFRLIMPDGTQRPSVSSVRRPALEDTRLVASGDCVRGFVTFEVPLGERPKFVLCSGSRLEHWWVVA